MFEITVNETSERQKASGMLANVQIDIMDDNGRVAVRLYDGTLRASRDGNFFLASPQRSYEKDGETKYASYWRAYPEDREASDSFNAWIVDEVKKKIGTLTSVQSAPSTPVKTSGSSFPFGK